MAGLTLRKDGVSLDLAELLESNSPTAIVTKFLIDKEPRFVELERVRADAGALCHFKYGY